MFVRAALAGALMCSPLGACGDDDVLGDAGALPDGALPDSSRNDGSIGLDTAVEDSGVEDSGTEDSGTEDAGSSGPLKAFPTAFGGGAEASGGRGGVLIVVNSPDPNAPLTHVPAEGVAPERYEGGLYAALRHDGAAYIVFDRSMNIRQPVGGTGSQGLPGVHDKTIFGQSAPRGGITITGGVFSFNGQREATRNLIFRYFRSRPILDENGDLSPEGDLYTTAILFRTGEDIVVDHCSFSFAQSKAIAGIVREPGNGLERLTISRNFVSDTGTGIYVEINPNRPGDPEEYVDRVSFLSNMTVGMNRTPNVAFDGFAEVINSVVYGDTYKSTTMYHDLRINLIGNYYLGPLSGGRPGFNRVFDHEGVVSVYAAGNFSTGLLAGTAGENNQPIFKFRDDFASEIDGSYFVSMPFESPDPHRPVILSADEAHASVVARGNIGAYRYLDDEGRAQTYRDPYDTSQLEAVRTRGDVTHADVEYWVLPVIPETVRPGAYDTDMDGMSDAWERRVIGDLSESYNDDHDADGYENIEEYMNQVDE